MFVQRYYLTCLSHASYMVADEETRIAAVIDPQRDIDQYIEDAQRHGFQIRYVVLTHFHADFVAGHIELRDRAGATICLGRRAEAEFEYRSLADGDAIELGDVRLVALETPGHTPEGITLLAYESAAAKRPYAAFTGDTLFIGDVGRPDLLASIGFTSDELAEMLYQSLHEKLLPLPDETLVYPAHGAGSMCGKALSDEAVSTIGEQRRYNYALQPMSKDDFISLVGGDQPEAPDYFVHDAIMNRQERAGLDQSIAASKTALTVEQVLQYSRAGAQLVDTRDPADFAGSHFEGAINIGIDGKYATWAGSVLDRDKPIVVIADDDRIDESIMRLGRIGLDNVVGFLDRGMRALAEHEGLVRQTRRITAPALAGLLPCTVIDVRSPAEREAGHIESSIHIPLGHLKERAKEIPADDTVVVHCAGGYRSSIAVSILQQLGLNAYDLVGGFKAWKQSGLPVVEAASQEAV